MKERTKQVELLQLSPCRHYNQSPTANQLISRLRESRRRFHLVTVCRILNDLRWVILFDASHCPCNASTLPSSSISSGVNGSPSSFFMSAAVNVTLSPALLILPRTIALPSHMRFVRSQSTVARGARRSCQSRGESCISTCPTMPKACSITP